MTMEASKAEDVFESHRLINDYAKIVDRDNYARYTLRTTIQYYQEYMLDYDWLDVIEIISTTCDTGELPDYQEPDWPRFLSWVMPDPANEPHDALLFVVEVEK